MRQVRPPLFAIALLLLGLITLLATLQYHWLGQISEAERARMQETLHTGAQEFAADLDRELTRAYLLFQTEPTGGGDLPRRLADRYGQWQATARFPRMIKEVFVLSRTSEAAQLQQFDPSGPAMRSVQWPASMQNWQEHFGSADDRHTDLSPRGLFLARVSPPIWERVPAVVVPAPLPLMFPSANAPVERWSTLFSYVILTIDLDFVKSEVLPALADRYFNRASGLDFQIAVISTRPSGGIIYTSTPAFTPAIDARGDAAADLFQVRTRDFATLAAEVRRFTSFELTTVRADKSGQTAERSRVSANARSRGARGADAPDIVTFREASPLTIVVQSATEAARGAVSPGPRIGSTVSTTTAARLTTLAVPGWRLVLRHSSGSLEAAVAGVRRRNLLISSSILAVLGASMGLLVLSTRRAQRLARQQMEFVAAVSHELRTPLAVIRSAADNLADGVVATDDQVKKYGELMRTEGRRLTEMVEQILELAGIQSGQRGFALRAVALERLLHDIIAASASLIRDANVTVEATFPRELPPVLGDESALRRVFQNLIGNALKYGASGGWIGITAVKQGTGVAVTVADRGMGIPAAEQGRIFEPFYRASDAVARQIQGAGLGLSLVQRIVDAHGGHVTVISTPGQGAAFTVVLPSAGEDPVATHAGATQPASS